MSMFWSGDIVMGLLLQDADDIRYFKEAYVKQNPDEFDPENELSDNVDCLDDHLLCCEDMTGVNGKPFRARLLDDSYEGLFFTSANENTKGCAQLYTPIIIICAERQPVTRGILKNGYYNSLDAIVMEMKNKVGGYLPDDFDYEYSIGDLAYALFA